MCVLVFVCLCIMLSEKGELSNPETAQRTLARGWLFYYTSFYIFMCYFPIFAFASCSLPLNHFHSMSPRCFCALPVFSVRFVHLYSVWFSIVLCVLLCFTITQNISHHSTEHRTHNRTAQHSIIISIQHFYFIAMYEHFLPYVLWVFSILLLAANRYIRSFILSFFFFLWCESILQNSWYSTLKPTNQASYHTHRCICSCFHRYKCICRCLERVARNVFMCMCIVNQIFRLHFLTTSHLLTFRG